MTMTDSVDFKAAKEWAKRNEEHFNTARVILALCELLKWQVDHCLGCGGDGRIVFDEVQGSVPLDCQHCAAARVAIGE